VQRGQALRDGPTADDDAQEPGGVRPRRQLSPRGGVLRGRALEAEERGRAERRRRLLGGVREELHGRERADAIAERRAVDGRFEQDNEQPQARRADRRCGGRLPQGVRAEGLTQRQRGRHGQVGHDGASVGVSRRAPKEAQARELEGNEALGERRGDEEVGG